MTFALTCVFFCSPPPPARFFGAIDLLQKGAVSPRLFFKLSPVWSLVARSSMHCPGLSPLSRSRLQKGSLECRQCGKKRSPLFLKQRLGRIQSGVRCQDQLDRTEQVSNTAQKLFCLRRVILGCLRQVWKALDKESNAGSECCKIRQASKCVFVHGTDRSRECSACCCDVML